MPKYNHRYTHILSKCAPGRFPDLGDFYNDGQRDAFKNPRNIPLEALYQRAGANVTTDKLFSISDAFVISLVELSAMSMSEAEVFHLIRRARIRAGMEVHIDAKRIF